MLLNNANKSDGLANRSACKDNAARSRPTRFFRLVIKMATNRKTPYTQFSKSFPDWCFSKMMKYWLKSRSHLFKSSKKIDQTVPAESSSTVVTFTISYKTEAVPFEASSRRRSLKIPRFRRQFTLRVECGSRFLSLISDQTSAAGWT